MSKHKKNKCKQVNSFWVALSAVVVLALIALAVVLAAMHTPPEHADPGQTNDSVKIENSKNVNISLGYDLYIKNVAKYTGVYMEDGSDELVTGVLMIIVENTGDTDVQFAEIEMPFGNKTAHFKLTTLPAGERILLLETDRMAYADVEFTTAASKNVALFNAPLKLYEDTIKIQVLNGAINVTNISGVEITGNIVIYYKNSSTDMLYGGITYRVIISGGMAAGEIKQIAGDHFSTSGSRIMFVTIG